MVEMLGWHSIHTFPPRGVEAGLPLSRIRLFVERDGLLMWLDCVDLNIWMHISLESALVL